MSYNVRVYEIHMIYYPYPESEETAEDIETALHISSRLRIAFTDVFDTGYVDRLPANRETDHSIDLKPSTDPPFQRLYQLSPTEQKALSEFITEGLEKGIIRESISPAGAPILFVSKKDGTLRLYIDYRGLNTITIKNRHPLPLISEILDRLNDSTIFSKIDLKNMYYRIRIKERDEWKTAFCTQYGHYKFLVIPFGLTNVSATFQAYINRTLWGYIDDFCIVYLDDILIFSRDEEQHQQYLDLVLEQLRQFELYTNPSKCSFNQKEVEYLGFIINAQDIQMDPNRVQTIEA
jgi:hypothetical protein